MLETPAPDSPILVAVDFSFHSEAALVWAFRVARSFAVPLIVLHVVHDPGSAPGYYAHTKRRKHLRRLEEAAGEMLEEFLAAATAKHPELGQTPSLESALVVGLPVNRILEFAETRGAQMIVMGSLGRTGLAFLGSKAERVVRLSPISVTVVKAGTRRARK